MIAKGLDPDAPPPAAAPAAAPVAAPAPARAAAAGAAKAKGDKEAEAAAAAAAAAGFKRSYAWAPMSLEEATEKICALRESQAAPGLTMLRRMIENVAKNPAEPKYRKVRLSNAKVAEGLVHVPGVRHATSNPNPDPNPDPDPTLTLTLTLTRCASSWGP